MEFTDAQVIEVMTRLGVRRADLISARSSQQALDVLKGRVRKAYKALALDCHPDRTGGDPDKTELLRLATAVMQEFNAMQVCFRPRRVRLAMRIRSMGTV